MNEPSSRFPEGNAMYFMPLFCQLQTYAYGCWNEGKSTQFIFSAFCLQKPCFAMLSYALTVYTPTVFGKLLWTENGPTIPRWANMVLPVSAKCAPRNERAER